MEISYEFKKFNFGLYEYICVCVQYLIVVNMERYGNVIEPVGELVKAASLGKLYAS